jgi:hypothetical protein
MPKQLLSLTGGFLTVRVWGLLTSAIILTISSILPAAFTVRATGSYELHLPVVSFQDLQTGGGSILWGAYNNGAPFNMDILAAFEQTAGKRVSIVHWGQPWMMNGKYMPFQTSEFDKVRQHGSIPMLNWGSWHLGDGIDQPDFRLSTIYQGQHDEYLRKWAAAARDWGHPFFLRFDHEMNGWWYPWSEQVNGNRPGDFVRSWTHIHDIFKEVGATNVSWVWALNIINEDMTPAASLYPGDQYVDWVAIDGYNWQYFPGSIWQGFAEIMEPTYRELERVAPAKPVMIAEFASAEYLGDPDPNISKALWIQDALQVQIPHHFPRVKAIVWFNWNDDDPDNAWPITSSPEAAAAFAQAISLDIYSSNTFGDLADNPIPSYR